MQPTAQTLDATVTNVPATQPTSRVPLWLKLAYTAFMAVMIPVYLVNYGPTNFLYFCDVTMILSLIALWWNKPLLISMGAVGVLAPQLLWCVDFVAQFFGWSITGMTDYMFDPKLPLFARSLSMFHGWLPFFLLFVLARMGYDKRALPAWTLTAWSLMLISYFFLPRPGAVLANPKAPVNIDYVFGLSDRGAQTWMPEVAWLVFMMVALPIVFFIPTHFALTKLFKPTTV